MVRKRKNRVVKQHAAAPEGEPLDALAENGNGHSRAESTSAPLVNEDSTSSPLHASVAPGDRPLSPSIDNDSRHRGNGTQAQQNVSRRQGAVAASVRSRGSRNTLQPPQSRFTTAPSKLTRKQRRVQEKKVKKAEKVQKAKADSQARRAASKAEHLERKKAFQLQNNAAEGSSSFPGSLGSDDKSPTKPAAIDTQPSSDSDHSEAPVCSGNKTKGDGGSQEVNPSAATDAAEFGKRLSVTRSPVATTSPDISTDANEVPAPPSVSSAFESLSTSSTSSAAGEDADGSGADSPTQQLQASAAALNVNNEKGEAKDTIIDVNHAGACASYSPASSSVNGSSAVPQSAPLASSFSSADQTRAMPSAALEAASRSLTVPAASATSSTPTLSADPPVNGTTSSTRAASNGLSIFGGRIPFSTLPTTSGASSVTATGILAKVKSEAERHASAGSSTKSSSPASQAQTPAVPEQSSAPLDSPRTPEPPKRGSNSSTSRLAAAAGHLFSPIRSAVSRVRRAAASRSSAPTPAVDTAPPAADPDADAPSSKRSVASISAPETSNAPCPPLDASAISPSQVSSDKSLEHSQPPPSAAESDSPPSQLHPFHILPLSTEEAGSVFGETELPRYLGHRPRVIQLGPARLAKLHAAQYGRHHGLSSFHLGQPEPSLPVFLRSSSQALGSKTGTGSSLRRRKIQRMARAGPSGSAPFRTAASSLAAGPSSSAAASSSSPVQARQPRRARPPPRPATAAEVLDAYRRSVPSGTGPPQALRPYPGRPKRRRARPGRRPGTAPSPPTISLPLTDLWNSMNWTSSLPSISGPTSAGAKAQATARAAAPRNAAAQAAIPAPVWIDDLDQDNDDAPIPGQIRDTLRSLGLPRG